MALYTIPVTYAIWFVGLFNKYGKLKYYIAQSWVNPWLWAARAKTTFTKAVEYKIMNLLLLSQIIYQILIL